MSLRLFRCWPKANNNSSNSGLRNRRRQPPRRSRRKLPPHSNPPVRLNPATRLRNRQCGSNRLRDSRRCRVIRCNRFRQRLRSSRIAQERRHHSAASAGAADHRVDRHQGRAPRSRRTAQEPAHHQVRRHLRRRPDPPRFHAALELRPLPGYSHRDGAGRTAQLNQAHVCRHRAPRHPHHPLRRAAHGYRIGTARPVQRAQGRPDRRIAIRSQQGAACGHRAQGLPG